jgi:hypothetical protein
MLASQILERVAIYVEESSTPKSLDQTAGDHDSSQTHLEYLCLRVALVGVTTS